MKNLNRALRMALKFRWSLISSLICSFLVAILWGANLGAVYPFIEVVLHDKSLHDWVDENIANYRAEIAQRRSQLNKDQDADLPTGQQRIIEHSRLLSEIDFLQQKLDRTEYVAPWIRRYAPDDPFETLKWIVVVMVMATFARCLFLAANMVLVARVGHRTILDLQNQVFNNVLRLEISEIGVVGTGDLINRIRGETNAIGVAINAIFGKMIREPMKMLACLVGAACVNWRLLLFSMLICPLALVVMIALARQTKRANRKALEESARLLSRLYQALTYLRVVKSYNMQDQEAQRFKQIARHVYKKVMRISLLDALARSNAELLSVTVIGLSVLAGGYLVLNQQTHLFFVRMSNTPMDFGQVMLFFAFLIGAVDPLRKLGDVYNGLQGGMAAADRVFPIVDQTPLVVDPAAPISLSGCDRSIEFCGVSFAYEPGQPVLHDVSFKLPSASSLAIIGHNGCGKSTLINLLPRFFDPAAGTVKIGGVDIRQLGLTTLRNEIGYVSQTAMLFGDSVYSNISYGTSRSTSEEVVAAAQKAHADSFINQLPRRYETEIGEHGNNLSGGQRQRLSLARAILKNPRILILDEATSQIDPDSERFIQDALREFIAGRTTLIVTHRQSTLELVDFVLVLENGSVLDFGRPGELMERCPAYRRFHRCELKAA
jgi:ATP-binding cassette subfamily B protein/subfamily B ATP-binding cassette protein MsbA